MSLLEMLQKRHSIRKYTGANISDQDQSVIFCGQFNTCLSVSLPAPAFALV